MAFQLKDFASITASMVNHVRAVTKRITDFNVGSTVRSMLEAVAIEIDQLYQEMFHGLKEAIPVSTYTTFNFELLPRAYASGAVRFSVPSAATAPVVIPVGTIVRQPGSSLSYTTTAQAVIPIGQTQVTTLAVASTTGAAGNATAGTITEIVGTLAGTVAVTNPADFINGRDDETEEQRKIRFVGYIQSLARGVKAAIEYGAKTSAIVDSFGLVTEYVVLARVYEPYVDDSNQPIALVKVYIHNGSGATSSALVTRCQQVIDGYYETDGTSVVGWKAAGVIAEVEAASELNVNVAGTLEVLPGYVGADVKTAAEAAARSYLQGLGIGGKALRSEIIERVMATPGVYNFVPSSPTADVTASVSQKIMPGTVGLTLI